VKWTPTNDFTVSANYIHTNLHGLPDFGVPYNNVAGAPVTSLGVPRQTYYGFTDRDFQVATQDIATITSEYRVSDALHCPHEQPGRCFVHAHQCRSAAG
jgi:catecholate siderophore receptor